MHCSLPDWPAIAMQFQEAKTGKVTCRCGITIPLRFAFRCLYCGEYFCTSCAEEHFGMTREEYKARRREADNDPGQS